MESTPRCSNASSWTTTSQVSSRGGATNIGTHSARLEFHAPRIPPPTTNSSLDLKASEGLQREIQAYNQAVAEIAQGLLRLAQKYDSPARSPMVPPTLLKEALQKTGDQFLRVETVGSVVRWGIRVTGYAGVSPRSKDDVVRACLLASAKANEWSPDFASSLDHEEYIAFYDSNERKLTAQVVISGIEAIACELEFGFDDQFKGPDNEINATANLAPRDSIARSWIKGTRNPVQMTLQDFSIMPPNTLLRNLPTGEGAPIDPNALATVGYPDWCRSRQLQQLDEKAICKSAKLSAFDVILNRFYGEALRLSGSNDRIALQDDQRKWLAKRHLCKGGVGCLEEAYRTRIDDIRPLVR
jgi:hypothetical protein